MNDHLIKETQKIISYESYPGKEKDVSDYIKTLMIKLGFRDVNRDKFGSIFGFVGPKKSNTSILFDSHTDVMPVRGNWKFPPFSGQIDNNKIYGRGSTDMKGSLCASIFAAAEMQKENKLNKQYVVSASVLEEEVEGVALGNIIDIVKPENVIICEPSKLKIKLGHKGRIEYLLDINGETFHSAFPGKFNNTINLAADALNALKNIKFINSHEMGDGILTPTGLVTNSNTSMAPSKTTIRFDRRTVPGDTEESTTKEIMDVLSNVDNNAFSLRVEEANAECYTGKKITCRKIFKPWVLDKNHKLVNNLSNAVEKNNLDVNLGYWGFCTNGVESMGNRKINTIGFGPGDEELAHTTNEYLEIEQLVSACKVYKELINIVDQD